MPNDAFETPDDTPMTEAQWEEMMRKSDLKAARFGELLETLHEQPDWKQKVAREMGWDDLADAMEELESDAPDEPDDTATDLAEPDYSESSDLDARDSDSDDPFPEDDHDREVKHIPAYAASDRAASAVRDFLKPFQDAESKFDEDTQDLIGEAFIGIHIACAKISGGHAMGYDDDVLCGNIVNNKRALEGAKQSIHAFEELVAARILPSAGVEPIMKSLRDAEHAIEDRIAELRQQVWW